MLRPKCKFICLDEATSNLDEQTDQILHQELYTFCDKNNDDEEGHGKGLLVITHRLENIKLYDKVIVMEAGKIVEFDSPQKLISNSNSFLNVLI